MCLVGEIDDYTNNSKTGRKPKCSSRDISCDLWLFEQSGEDSERNSIE